MSYPICVCSSRGPLRKELSCSNISVAFVIQPSLTLWPCHSGSMGIVEGSKLTSYLRASFTACILRNRSILHSCSLTRINARPNTAKDMTQELHFRRAKEQSANLAERGWSRKI